MVGNNKCSNDLIKGVIFMGIDLRELEVYSASEAAMMWGKSQNFVRHLKINGTKVFPEGTIRKFGNSWLVTREGIEEVLGCGPQMTLAQAQRELRKINQERRAKYKHQHQ